MRAALLRMLIPPALKDWLRLARVRRRYPEAGLIETGWVAAGADLGVGCALGPNVIVNAGVVLGDYSYANVGAIISSGRIGRFCSLGPYCDIGSPDHPLGHLSTSPALYRGRALSRPSADWDDFPEPPQLGADVWVGAHAVILQGVTIGTGAAIAAGAVVTHDVRPYAVVAGLPAHEMRRRFDDDTVRYLLASRWWDLPLKELAVRYSSVFRAGDDWPNVSD
jgi:acetyltransferase-like isoleucine patch superfamily enzyme